MIRWVALGLFAVSVTAASAQRPCAAGGAHRAASTAQAQQLKLLHMDVEEMETSVSPMVRSRIAAFKDALTQSVDATLACAPADRTAAALQLELATPLHGNQPEKPFVRSDGPSNKPIKGIYGDELKIKVTTPANVPQLRMIELSFDIDCGADSLLLVYEARPAGWQRIVRWQSDEYKEISGAFGDIFAYRVIPATDSRPMRIVTVHGTPWCTSRFSSLGIDLLDPSPEGERPRVIWHADRGYSRGDAETRLFVTGDGFQVRTNVPASNPMDYERSVIFGYRIQGDHVTRTGPIATNGRGFVDEWLNMSWDEAKEQTDPASLAKLKAVYDRFEGFNKTAKNDYFTRTHGPVLACRAAKEFQVEVRTTKEIFMQGVPGGRQEKLPSLYFRIVETGDGYRMLAASEKAGTDCAGPNLMKDKN